MMFFRMWRWLQLLPYRMRPFPTNKRLQKLIAGSNRIIIKQSGVWKCKAMDDMVVLSIMNPDDVTAFSELLEIHEPKQWFHCMCCGDYAIEFYAGQQLRSTISLHHGASIRYDKWYGDAELSKADLLLQFLAEKGLRKPLDDKLENEKRNEAYEVQQRKWLGIAPVCFTKYSEQLTIASETLEGELEAEIPDMNERIIRLLKTYSCSEELWSGYPSYEELSYRLLSRIYIGHIISAYLESDRNYNIRKGLGRFLCCYESLKKRSAFLKHISTGIIDELQACFEKRNDEEGKNRIAVLRKEKESQHLTNNPSLSIP